MCDSEGLKEVGNFARSLSRKMFEMASEERIDEDDIIVLRKPIDEDFNARHSNI